MKIQSKYIVFIAIIHMVLIGLSFVILNDHKLIFIISEAFILVSLLISWQLYKDFIGPMQLLMSGTDAIRDKDFNVRFLKTGKPEMDQLIEVYNHMIDQIRNERTQQEQQHFFLEKLIHTSPTGILILDFDEQIATVNTKAFELLGLTENDLIGKSVQTIQHPVLQAIATLKSGEAKTISSHGARTYKCQKSHFIDRGFPRYFVMIEELTLEIIAAEKKAYGKVIRMMAHEVNNSIGAVNSILDTTKEHYEQQADIRNALQVAMDRNERLNRFMKNFAEVVRIPEPRLEKVDIHQLISSVAAIMRFNAEKQHITFEFEMPSDPLYILADVSQLEQVFINIIKNAFESIHQNRIHLKDPSYTGKINFKTSINPPQLSFEDNGAGISLENAGQIFTPFFSTKQDGQGIGLAVIREILNNHRFKYSLKTSMENVTTFQIIFV